MVLYGCLFTIIYYGSTCLYHCVPSHVFYSAAAPSAIVCRPTWLHPLKSPPPAYNRPPHYKQQDPHKLTSPLEKTTPIPQILCQFWLRWL